MGSSHGIVGWRKKGREKSTGLGSAVKNEVKELLGLLTDGEVNSHDYPVLSTQNGGGLVVNFQQGVIILTQKKPRVLFS